jgi:hypothetical protein
MRLIRIGQAAKMLGVDPDTLRRHIKGDYATIFGLRLRAFPMDLNPGCERRFDADEIRRLLAQLERSP